MEQLILHLVGDYILQSHYVAQKKTKNTGLAFGHAVMYSMPFLLLCPSAVAFIVILFSHMIIDRFRLARYVIFAKNFFSPGDFSELDKWSDCSATGFHKSTPDWLAVWLMIIVDNTIHLAINYAALRWL